MLSRTFVILLFGVLAFATVGQEPAKPPLKEAIKEVLGLPRYKTAHWGLYVIDAKTGEVLLDHQAEKMFAPASNTKIFSVAAALEVLGPDHRFHTKLLHTGTLDADSKTLKGDLILLASGDPTLGGRTLPDGSVAFKNSDHTYNNGQLTEVDPLQGIQQLAVDLAKQVKQIEGEIIIDDRLFDRSESTGSGPTHVTPIVVNDNIIDFTITPGAEPGQPAKVEHRPAGSAIIVDAQVETVASKDAKDKPVRPTVTVALNAPGRYVVRGKIPAGSTPLVRTREVDDPASHARSLLIDALVKAGVKVKSSSLQSNPGDKLPVSLEVQSLPMLAELVSPPFAEHAKLILKVSHNLHASMLPLHLAVKNKQRTLAQGLRQQSAALKKLGVPMDSISFGGGAGGSRADFASPKATVTLLKNIARRSDAEVFRKALPIVGVDGTAAVAVGADSPAKGKFFAKTGTYSLSNGLANNSIMTSKALSGYGTTSKGREVIFSFFVNNALIPEDGTTQAGKDLGRLCELVYLSE